MLERVAMIDEVISTLSVNSKNAEYTDPLAEEWNAFVSSVEEHGVIEPLKVVTGTNLVVDGRHRRRAAIEGGVLLVRVEYVSEERGHAIIEESVCARRQWTKSMRAWFAVCQHPEVVDEKAGRKKSGSDCRILSQPQLAEKYGVSERLIRDAVSLARLFKERSKEKAKRKLVEAKIWSGGLSLDKAANAFGSMVQNSGKGVDQRQPKAVNAIRGVRQLRTQASRFDEWAAEEQVDFVDEFSETWRALPDSAREQIRTALETEGLTQ